MAATVYTLAASFRAALLQREERAQAEILRAYEAAWEAIELELAKVTTQIEASPDGDASPSLQLEQRRLRELERQVVEAIREVARTASDVTLREQTAVVRAAESQAATLIKTKRLAGSAVEAGVVFDRLPADVIQQLVGFASDGTPVRAAFERLAIDLGLETGARVRDALTQGVTLGWSPTQIARKVRREAEARGGNPMRAPAVVRRLNTLVRTETFRAYREATREVYQANKRLLRGWRWVSAKSPTTCVVCWAMDGQVFKLTEPMQSHLNCRCVTVPTIIGEKEKYETGAERFAKLEPGVQRDLLGDAAFEAYRAGRLSLQDLVGVRTSEQWGVSRFRRSLKDVLGSDEFVKT